MRVLPLLAAGTTFFLLAAPLTAQAATGSATSLTPVSSSSAQRAAAAWPSCVKATRIKLNNDGWSDPKWQVRVVNNCTRTIKYAIVRDRQSDFGYVAVSAGKTGYRNIGKYSFGHSASEPDGVKIYYRGTRYTKRF
ncbi:hypothetical protein ACTMTI_44915 [Nonomuraea sp. H19]|uniref:hypothetical protein n=1 Tax=Nonomuraea sp. H19 TaxID=3452206 RepID=UPI003F895C00